MKFTSVIGALFCSLLVTQGADEIAPGIKAKKTEAGIVIALSKEAAVIVAQDKKDGKMVILSNLEGKLESTQLASEGKTPVSVEYTSDDKAKVVIQRGAELVPLVKDLDGDGIPDVKFDWNKEGKIQKYRLKSIQWEAVGEAK